jgi:iron complex outermembrane recepter protein
MKQYFKTSTIISLGIGIMPMARAQERTVAMSPLIVRGNRIDQNWSLTEKSLGASVARTGDAGGLIQDLPGAAIVRNGSQTGIVQLRGLSGDRVSVRVEGMAITPACPNHMDPPLHYANPSEGDLVKLYAGIAPVSVGGDHIGGAVAISRGAPEFTKNGSRLQSGEFSAGFMGSQDAARLGADYTFATEDLNLRYRGYGATANDLRIPGGSVRASGYDTTRHDLSGAWRTNGGFIAVDAGMGFTRDSGTPALPMDMIKDDSWHFGLAQREVMAWGTIENRLYVHDVDHLMDNFSLRPVTMGGMAMEAPATSRDYGWKGDLTLPLGQDNLRFGLDFHRAEFDADQVAVTTGMRRETFEDNQRTRAGAFGEWERDLGNKWSGVVGLRANMVSSDAGAVSNQIMNMGMVKSDRDAFNAADRSFTEVMVDATAAIRYEVDKHTGVELAAGLKNRAPSLVERYLWTPSNASAGLADGRTYLGNLDLDPETAIEIALSMKHGGEAWSVGITPFYQHVSDYIQGMPIARNDSSGKPVLQYQNLDEAELYGLEFTAACDLGLGFSVDSSLSYVRGRSDETGGDLYRIAPLRGIVDLGWRRDSWESHLECVWAGAQNDVSELQGESPSAGYALFNLRLAKTFAESIRVEVGVENLLDKNYADHLGGVNRVGDSDVGIGERIPGTGRFGYASVTWKF